MINFTSYFNQFESVQSEKLNELVTLGKELHEDVLGQMLELFRESTTEIIEKLHLNFQLKNTKEIAAFAHQLKSSAGNIGLTKLHQMCTYLEKGIKESSLNTDEISNLVVMVEKEFLFAMSELKQFEKAA